MSDIDGTCEYVLDPDDPETWGGEEGDECYVDEEVLNEDGVWTCPHNAEEEDDLCIFHLPVQEKDEKKVVDAFLDVLEAPHGDNSERSRKRQFIGGQFGEFDLIEIDIDGDGIILAYATIEDSLNWFGTSLDVPYLRFQGAVFKEDVIFEEVKFDGDVDFSLSEFKNKCDFRRTRFSKTTTFYQADFNSNIHFEEAEFMKYAGFQSAIFVGDVKFRNAVFNSNTTFSPANEMLGRETKFEGNAIFRGVVFESDVDFSWVKFMERVDFGKNVAVGDSSAKFNGEADFRDITVIEYADFSRVRFEEEALFQRAEFETTVDFGNEMSVDPGAEFGARADFTYAEFGEPAVFTRTNFSEGANFRRVKLQDSDFSNADLTDSDFDGADLRETDLESSLLSRATLFGADLRGAKLSGAVLGDVRIDEDTRFLGYPSDDSSSSSHTLSAIRSQPTCVYDPDYEEDNEHEDADKAKSVYRALEELGGKHARPRLQARSFVRRQDLQKKDYWDDATADDASLEERFIAGARWSRARVARATLLYGESPWRVVGTSLATVFVFALLYSFSGLAVPSGSSVYTYGSILSEPTVFEEFLYHSLFTFTSGTSGLRPVGFSQTLMTIERAVGILLISVFGFVFGRRAAR